MNNPENEAEANEARETGDEKAKPASSAGELTEESLDQVSGGVIPHTYRNLKSPFEEDLGE